MTGGRLSEASDPYRLTVEQDRTGVAEYFVDEVRAALLLEQVDTGPTREYLLPGPAVPITVAAGDGTVAFDGDRVTLEWNWTAEEAKRSGGTRGFGLADLRTVEWSPSKGLSNGWLRFLPVGVASAAAPKYDPFTVELFGFKNDPLMALVAAAVALRLPHPAAAAADGAPAAVPVLSAAAAPPEETAADHDTLLRRLRELGEMHQTGILTAEEFTAAKQAVLRRF